MASNVALKKKVLPIIPIIAVSVMVLLAVVGGWLYYTNRSRDTASTKPPSPEAKAYVKNLKLSAVKLRATQSFAGGDLVEVIDADALNMLAQTERFWEHLPPRAVLTPHPGEMARLTGMSVAAIQADRLNIARKYAADWGTTVLLKGAHTVIADSDRVSVLPFKTSALAKAGTGDVLAGAIGAFAHTVFTIHDAAVIAGFLHGAAGHSASRRWGGTRSALASDVIENFGTVMHQLEHSV
mgnify:CR=1 FL=1